MNASASPQIELHAHQGAARLLQPSELPFSIGGEDAAIIAPGLARGAVAARLGADEHGLYVEPVDQDGLQPRLNAQSLTERSRLAHGDVLGVGDALVFFLLDGTRARVQVEQARQDLTEPPVVDEGTADAEGAEEAGTESIQRTAFRPLLRAGGARGARGPSWRWALGAGVVMLAAALWLLVTSSPVLVQAQPQDADVNFEGAWFELAFGEHYLLRPGNYTVVAAREGYETLRQPVEVTAAADQQVRLELHKLPGKVRIDTGAVSALLEVDGEAVGEVPGEYPIEAGTREFTLRAPRHQDLVQTVEVEGGGAEQALTLRLTPDFSPVTIESQPTGARVTLNGEDLGVTPLTADIDAGAHALGLEAAGFRRWESTIQVQPDTPQTIGPVELGLPDGRLTVSSEPAGADVAIAGRYRGRTPLDVSLAPGITYTVQITRPGYEPAGRTVPIKAAARSAMSVELTPILGEVTVRGEPADAQLFVDGTSRGAANQTLQLPSTALKVEVRREGYLTYTTTVTPQPGVARVVEYRLLTPAQAQAARTPDVIATSLGGQLRLMPTGSYTMGSDRREAGRRTNESQRQVTLQRLFYLATKEITNAEFRQFQPDHLSGIVKNRSLDVDNRPVVSLSWREAVDFCNWLSKKEGLPPAYEQRGDVLGLAAPANTGYRLPTEAEWEWGARHQSGREQLRIYQWGQSLPIPRNAGNYGDKSSLLVQASPASGLAGYDDGFVTTAPVGKFAANALGLFDMDGNVTEWVNDFYTVYRELDTGPATDPSGPASGNLRVIRGANWRTTDVTDLRLAWRDSFGGKAQYIGFRIARYAQ